MRHTDEVEDHDRGLSHDLPTLVGRRRLLGLLGGAGAAALVACTPGDGSSTTSGPTARSTSPSSRAGTTQSGGSEIPEETNGPFPADGSNGVNVLTATGIVRSDIRSSFGEATGTAEGVPLDFTLTVVDVSSADEAGKPLAGAAVYVWHCDRAGAYSMYSDEAKDENYLRGVQETDQDGRVTFTSIFPACYDGRWPHIHFEVYPSLADATSATGRMRTSQLAFPQDVCESVYATKGYETSVANLARVSLDSDLVFSDGYSLQMATVSGSASDGCTATLRVPV
ncbi:hypothetical protein ASD11_10585 [Aeromicrobium sp. Root495]|uniref:intradiol ring-cleavage dioxygenase n=1 Tax=Aeromicrobium sp. Root495 TaxID=1736550 RepID=UPI0007016C87|nr:intradiol ring-cleavage dioxygenase [Aeromicrobium sp. Root495]KQY59943.1 hypothetical protein ASD11_10585 [Aeromicrobium sp. Root495]